VRAHVVVVDGFLGEVPSGDGRVGVREEGLSCTRQLEERERVAVALRNDLIAHRSIQWAVHMFEQ
jgi:hypothetical protein